MSTSQLQRVEHAKEQPSQASAGSAQDVGSRNGREVGLGEPPGGWTPISDGRRLGESNEGAGVAQAVELPAGAAAPVRESVVLGVLFLALLALPVLVLWSQV